MMPGETADDCARRLLGLARRVRARAPRGTKYAALYALKPGESCLLPWRWNAAGGFVLGQPALSMAVSRWARSTGATYAERPHPVGQPGLVIQRLT